MTGQSDPAGSSGAAEAGGDTSRRESDRGRAYGGVLGAFPYAFRASDSRLFRSYALVGGVVAGLLAVLFLLALVRLLGGTAGARFSVARAFFVLVGLGAVAPLVAPVLFVARAHRRGTRADATHDAVLAAAGYLFLASLYVGAVAAMPATFQLDGSAVSRPAPSGAFAPVVAALYALPSVAGLVVPTFGALTILAARRAVGSS